MIDLSPKHLGTVQQILDQYAPGARTQVFGSRATGKAKPSSDLDLLVDTGTQIDIKQLFRIQDAFEESDLPFRVDVIDAHRITGDIQTRIESEAVPLNTITPNA